MAFDDVTRGHLQRFVSDARTVLTNDFALQFQQEYGLDPVSGSVAGLNSLELDDQRLETARILREILDHYLAASISQGAETKRVVLDRMVREQAFTTLNRLAALRMMESRGLVMECVAKGYQSKAFQLYQRVAGSALGETGDAYRVFLLSLCDLYSDDMPALFDRHYPNGRLFPREFALLQVLDLTNAPKIEPLWSEDETIGWVYQYFNSKEERKAMRDASKVPRNTRELAVRNQFFTPRYVVEFLVDNTLGKLWLDWTGNQTGLRDRCRYLLVKPDEKPKAVKRLRDPRTIKLIDPACGSMHFGLYAFDLFLEIYRESWAWEQQHGPGVLDVSTQPQSGFKPLSHTYVDEDAFLRDVPRLIIEHNIFGVDIDARAAQIASLALWLRAQRTWHEAGLKVHERPQVGQGHVVPAVAPPTEIDLRRRAVEKLDQRDAELFEKTLILLKALPELGLLLQVEKDLPNLTRAVFGKHGALFEAEDIAQWQKAESRLQDALVEFAKAARSTYQGRLFAVDALRGLRIIDLLGCSFDVVVMNPPFGSPSPMAREYIDKFYEGAHGDIYCSFVRRATEIAPRGYIGCITSSSFMLSPRLEDYRKRVLARLSCIVDCGLGVMDDAMVRAAIYVLEPQQKERFAIANAKPHLAKLKAGASPATFTELFEKVDKQSFMDLPQSRLLIDAPSNVRRLMAQGPFLEPEGATAREGMKTFDNERFIRLPWEVDSEKIGPNKNWRWLSKGGEFAFFYSEIHLVLNWSRDGAELREVNLALNGSTAQVRQASSYWGLEGATYSKRSTGFSARALPEKCIFTSMGPAVLPLNGTDPLYLLGWLNSRLIRALTHLNAGAFDNYTTGALKRLPWKAPEEAKAEQLRTAVISAVVTAKRFASQSDECSRWFTKLPIRRTLEMTRTELEELARERDKLELQALAEADKIISELYELPNLEWTEQFLKDLSEDDDNEGFHENSERQDSQSAVRNFSESDIAHRTISYLVGVAFDRWTTEPDLGPGMTADLDSALACPPALPPGATSATSNRNTINSVLPTASDFGASLTSMVHQKARAIFGGDEELEQRCVSALSTSSLDSYLDDPKGFFSHHLDQYTISKRQAPIYWPISTASGSYTFWIYYPKLTSQTLYVAVNDFVEPKLKQVEQQVTALRATGNARSRQEQKRLETLEILQGELVDLNETLLRIAQAYRPNHDDGVQITAAPLWPLFRHKAWQKLLKETWSKLENGDYDWAHLALTYWPDRVREKCKTDKSLAIAHDLEHLYVEPKPAPPKTRGRKKKG
jgi:hypothetical protein